MILSCFPLVWRLVTHDHNYYWDRGYGIDRLMVAMLFVSLVFRPVMIAPLLLVSLPLLFQFQHPLQGATWSTASLSVRLQILFLAYLSLALASNRRLTDDRTLIPAVLLVVAFHYWPSGFAKLTSGWLIHDRIHVLLSATTAAGWLAAVPQEQLDSIARTIGNFDFPLRLGALGVKLSGLFILWGRRRIMTLILAAFIVLHIGIDFLTGIYFFEWMMIEIGLLIVVHLSDKLSQLPRLSTGAKWFSSAAVASSLWWYSAPSLFWFDASASYSYEFHATDAHGTVQRLEQNFFAPISYEIRLQNLDYLVADTPLLDITFGATDRQTSQTLLSTRTVQELLEIEKNQGVLMHHSPQAKVFEQFVRQFVLHFNQRPELKNSWGFLAAPHCLLERYPSDATDLPSSISKIDIYQRFTFFDGTTTHLARRQKVSTIDIDPTEGSPAIPLP